MNAIELCLESEICRQNDNRSITITNCAAKFNSNNNNNTIKNN